MCSIRNKNVILWDWNGTILNDSGVCISAMNKLLTRYHYPEISRETYETHFDFPVSTYYKNIGWDFDKHSFEKVGLEFMDLYKQEIEEAPLQQDVRMVFNMLREHGFKQHLISAMQHDLLLKLTAEYHLHDTFESINGIEDHYGGGKKHIFEKAMERHHLNSDKTLMIGDTLHDAEIANELNIDCLLYYSGHQSLSRLASSGFPVLRSYDQLFKSL